MSRTGRVIAAVVCLASVYGTPFAKPAARLPGAQPAAASTPLPPAVMRDAPAAPVLPLTVRLDAEQATIPIVFNAPQADGLLDVTFDGGAASDIVLRAVPLRFGDARGFVGFAANGGRDTVRLDAGALGCVAGRACPVGFSVKGMWPPGLYEGAIEAWGAQGKLASAAVSVVRLAPSFHPVLTGSLLHDGQIDVDIEGDVPATFPLSIQNPVGSPPNHFALHACSPDPGARCPPPGSAAAGAAMSFLPSSFWLEPGATQAVSVTVQPCPVKPACSAAMAVEDADHTGSAMETVILVHQYDAVLWRQAGLLLAVVLGSAISVLLNNLFPATRAKQAIKDDLRRAADMVRDCPNAGAAVRDALGAEATRLKLVVKNIWFTDSTKEGSLRDAREAAAALAAMGTLARRLSLLRVDADGAVLSIVLHAQLREILQQAEEAILVGDGDTAANRLADAQSKLIQARTDALQAELRRTLGGSIDKLMDERGVRLPPPRQRTGPAGALTLQQPAGREPMIRALIEQIDADSSEYATLDTADLLDTERDFYVADIWTEYMERKLEEFDGAPPTHAPGDWAARKADWTEFSRVFLQCLRRNPKSDLTQTMLDLLRNDTTPADIAAALRAGAMEIQCDPAPKYLEPVDVGLVITSPLLADVAAARRFIRYDWSFGDDTPPPPDVDHCRHYFQRRPVRWWDPRGWLGDPPPQPRTITVRLSVPFTDAQNIPVTRTVELRVARSVSVTRLTGWINFLVTASIAVVTAFGAKYATSVPNVVGWPDCLTAFMLGFGLDQLRDLVSPTVPPTSSAPAPVASRPAHRPLSKSFLLLFFQKRSACLAPLH